MKILSIGNFGTGWDGSICDEEHIARALEELGHEVQRGQRGEENSYISGNTDPHDFILIAQWANYENDFIKNTRETINKGKTRLNCPVIYWAFDYQADGQDWHERLIAESDLYLSKRIADSKYPNWQWLSQDFAPTFLDRFPSLSSEFNPYAPNMDVLFTGTYLDYATERNQILKAVDEKFNLTIHSVNPDSWKDAGFKNVFGPVMDNDLPELIRRTKVNLSIDHTIEAGYWSDRPAQIMACGGFVLHRYQPLSSAVFRSYIGYFYDVETCLKCIEYWLEADEDRENLAGYGYEYAQRELKVKNRVEDLLNIVQGIL